VPVYSRSTSVPDSNTNYSLQLEATTGGALGANEFVQIRHFIEGYNAKELDGKQITLSFDVYATVTGQHALQFQNGGGDRRVNTSYTVDASNTWQRVSVTIGAPDFSDGTWFTTTGRGMQIMWGAQGSSRLAAESIDWTATPGNGATGSVNPFATTGDVLRIANIDCHAGTSPRSFQRAGNGFGAELALCQRYFYKTYDLDVDPGTSTNTGLLNYNMGPFPSTSGLFYTGELRFDVPMRAAPTIVSYSQTGTAGKWTTQASSPTPSVFLIGTRNAGLAATEPSAQTTLAWTGHFTADAEIA
jgi:hypothetical protein